MKKNSKNQRIRKNRVWKYIYLHVYIEYVNSVLRKCQTIWIVKRVTTNGTNLVRLVAISHCKIFTANRDSCRYGRCYRSTRVSFGFCNRKRGSVRQTQQVVTIFSCISTPCVWRPRARANLRACSVTGISVETTETYTITESSCPDDENNVNALYVRSGFRTTHERRIIILCERT